MDKAKPSNEATVSIGKIKQVNSTDMVKNLNAEYVQDAKPGHTTGSLVKLFAMPTQGTLISGGYLDSSFTETRPISDWLKATFDWFFDNYKERGTFIGESVPGTRGLLIIHKYDTTLYASGLFLSMNKQILCYYSDGVWSCQQITTGPLT